MTTTLTAGTLRPTAHPTFFFIGVSTGASSIRSVFPRWAAALRLGDAELVGIDLPVRAPETDYRRVVEFVKHDATSVGALVTTHKVDLFRAAADLIDEVDPLAALTAEVSCLVARDGRLRGSAKDPVSAGLAMDAFAPPAWWAAEARDVLLLGAGGSAVAIDWVLSRAERGSARPARVVVSDPAPERLAELERVHRAVGADVPLVPVRTTADVNDELLAGLRPGALVVNATGLGKDAPGSPLGPDARFPARSTAWELNYRGDLRFLDAARAQAAGSDLTVVDGWEYFLHGWTRVIAEVFDVDVPTGGPGFAALADLAAPRS